MHGKRRLEAARLTMLQRQQKQGQQLQVQLLHPLPMQLLHHPRSSPPLLLAWRPARPLRRCSDQAHSNQPRCVLTFILYLWISTYAQVPAGPCRPSRFVRPRPRAHYRVWLPTSLPGRCRSEQEPTLPCSARRISRCTFRCLHRRAACGEVAPPPSN